MSHRLRLPESSDRIKVEVLREQGAASSYWSSVKDPWVTIADETGVLGPGPVEEFLVRLRARLLASRSNQSVYVSRKYRLGGRLLGEHVLYAQYLNTPELVESFIITLRDLLLTGRHGETYGHTDEFRRQYGYRRCGDVKYDFVDQCVRGNTPSTTVRFCNCEVKCGF